MGDVDGDDIYDCAGDGNGIQRVRRASSYDLVDTNMTRIQLQVAYAAEFSGTDTMSLFTLSQLEEALLHAAITAALACGNQTTSNGHRRLGKVFHRSLSMPVTDTLGMYFWISILGMLLSSMLMFEMFLTPCMSFSFVMFCRFPIILSVS
jgi:hypothetical protein